MSRYLCDIPEESLAECNNFGCVWPYTAKGSSPNYIMGELLPLFILLVRKLNISEHFEFVPRMELPKLVLFL